MGTNNPKGGIATTGHDYIGVPGFEGLAQCVNCQCAEGCLPTHCPGKAVPARVQNMIHRGIVDFKGGRWVGCRVTSGWPRPSRISVDDFHGDDPGLAWWAWNAEVYLDGVRVRDCVRADATTGEVEVHIPEGDPRWKTEFLHATTWPTEIRRGRVEICAPAPRGDRA